MIGRRQVLLGLPLAVAVGGGGISYVMLQRMERGTYDPHGVPNPLVGKPVPHFALPPLGAGPGLASAELHHPGRPVLVNFFASWCVPCVQEAPELMALHDRAVPIYGIAYKDQPDAALGFLERHGNPYLRVATDLPGRTAIDFGLYGVPETYFIDRGGIIRWRWAGALTPDVAHDQLAALMRTYA
ncbi:MAG TPA: DsbE family thiol:disulfide interchange protein [Acetobacteraceae bacterium]|nr:DsbE family thiol:disulfide interchange protein [Acetobacteraceae bacterium]